MIEAVAGFLTNKAYADGIGPRYSYTLAGRLKTRAWARGITTTYSTNAAGDIASIDYSDSTSDVINTYDRRGRIATVSHGTNVTTLTYNDAGQLLSETVNGMTVSNTYNSSLLRTNLSLNAQPSTLNHSFTYDAAARLEKVSDGNHSATYTYHANSPLVNTITFRQGTTTRMTTTKSWDYVNRLTEISSAPSADSVLKFGYAYNSANQRTAVTNSDSSRFAYAYDSLGQLTSAKRYWSDGTVVAGQQFEYGYDDIGNRKFAASGGNEWGTGLREERYTVNNLNQYTQRTVPPKAGVIGSATNTAVVTVNNQPTWRKAEYYAGDVPVDNSAAPVWQSITNLGVLNNGTNADTVTNINGNVLLPKTPQLFSYDADGNLTSDGLWTNIWNGENRLIATESLSSVPSGGRAKQTWAYMSDGRWLERIVYTWNGSSYVAQSTNRFVWDGNVLLAILDHTNGVVTAFMRGSDLSGSPQGAGGTGGLLVTTIAGNGTHFAAFDGNGNVAALVSAADGKLSAIYEYAPFGTALRETGAVAKQNPIRFSTQYDNDVTSDNKYLYRDYETQSGRWKSRDSLEEAGGVNVNGFVQNNPNYFVDSDGRALVLLQPSPLLIPRLVLPPGGGVPIGPGLTPPVIIGPPVPPGTPGAKPNPPPGNPLQPAPSAGPSPSPTRPPPGEGGPPWDYGDSDCDPAEKARLNREMHAICDQPRSCRKCRDNLQEIWNRIHINENCQKARQNIMDKCYRGGDQFHKNELKKVTDVLKECVEAYRAGGGV